MVTGRWISPFTGKVIQNSSEIDIDHVVPLKWAWDHGASKWSREKRDQLRFPRDVDHLNKHGPERIQMLLSEIADRAVSGEIAGRQDPKGDIFFQLPGDLP